MNLIGGKIIDNAGARASLDTLYDDLTQTLSCAPPLTSETVIAACDTLAQHINEAEHLSLLTALGVSEPKAQLQLAQAKALLGRPAMETVVARGLPTPLWQPEYYCPPGRPLPVTECRVPLGVLLHIAAGNAHGLPVYSVIEGLLTGNINILKLPGADDGLSLPLLSLLLETEPALVPYVYVYDFASSDTAAMKRLAEVADAIVVWGGDEAVSAVRALATPNTRVIEWGHRVSFAYVTPDADDRQLRALADGICRDNGLLCSACQGIYLDTGNQDVLEAFALRFADILEQACRAAPLRLPRAVQAQVTLERYTAALSNALESDQLLQREGCSVRLLADPALHVSPPFRNVWVRPLAARDILPALKKYKSYLQTAALLCPPRRREQLARALVSAGVVRITGGAMSDSYAGMPHDGDSPLARYTKTVSIENP